jgi:hypothetical protein
MTKHSNIIKANGRAPFTTRPKGTSIAIPFTMYKFSPIGGVIFANSHMTHTNTPNQIGLYPRLAIMGNIVGSVRRIMGTESITIPSGIYINSTISSMDHGGIGRPPMVLEISAGIPLSARKELKIWAPIKMRNIMPVVLIVDLNTAIKIGHVSLRLKSVIRKAPNAPIAPASVGVNIPT